MFTIDPTFRSIDPVEIERFLNPSTGVRDIFDGRVINHLVRLTDYTVYQVSDPDRWRIDLVSFQVYGSVQYEWLLMIYNGFQHPRDLTTGTFVKCPAKADLDRILADMAGRDPGYL